MLSKEEVEAKYGTVIGESKNCFTVQKDDGTTAYICKFCGNELQRDDLLVHFNPRAKDKEKLCPNIQEKIELDREAKARQVARQEEMQRERTLTRERRILSPEEEMLEEMATTLQEELNLTPGTRHEKIDWVVRYFRVNKKAQTDPRELYRVLARTFPNLDDEAINLIVDNVFAVRQEYMKEHRGYKPIRQQPYGGSGFGMMDFDADMPPSFDPQTFTMWIMYQMWKDMRNNTRTGGVTREDLEQMLDAKLYKMLYEKAEEEKQRLYDTIGTLARQQPKTSGGWHDDAYRIVGEELIPMVREWLTETKKNRAFILKRVLPMWLKAGKAPIETEEFEEEEAEEVHEPTGTGKTDVIIISQLEKEGLVSEE